MNTKLILTTVAVATAVQLAMVIAGHYVPFIKNNVFALGGMAISLVAGLAYAKLAGGGWVPSLAGGAMVGGLCALIGIGVSQALKDVAPMILALGTLSSTVTGAIGGAIGKLLG
ncbi:hypothetical protein [Phenylobacterium sp.]|uniref:hypothetical protein n=1 Tax=Phenylobacterium sp. TaxID=1871053 RepID=UPI00286E46E3|nr:hypothetical protein [Phenylobacterium sp.]